MVFFPHKPQVESSLAFYDKVVDIWYKFLASVRSDASLAENVGKAQLSEGMDMLARVLSTRVNLLGDTHIATVSEGARCPWGFTKVKFRFSVGHLPLAGRLMMDGLFGEYRNKLSGVLHVRTGFLGKRMAKIPHECLLRTTMDHSFRQARRVSQ